MKWLLGLLAVFSAYQIYIKQSTAIELDYDLLSSEQIFEVSDQNNNHLFRYKLDDDSLILKGTATMTGVQEEGREFGALMALHMLTASSAEEFDKTIGRSNSCPASFFNRHADQKILFASNKSIEQKILDWDINDYRSASQWQDFTIKGRCIEKLIDGKLNGEDAELNPAYFKNCQFILVDELEVQPR